MVVVGGGGGGGVAVAVVKTVGNKRLPRMSDVCDTAGGRRVGRPGGGCMRPDEGDSLNI